MLRKIIETIFSKGITAICNLLILLLTAKYLGAHGRGEMAIIVLGISIVGLFQSILAGGALAYLIPRFKLGQLILCSSFWTIIIALITPLILVFTDLFPENYLIDLIFLSLILGFVALIQNSLIGLEEIRKQNFIEITKAVSTAFFLFWFIILQEIHTIDAVILALYFAYSISLGLSVVFLMMSFQKEKKEKIKEEKGFLHQFFKIGFQMQINNISQMVNYRFCYYLIEKFLGLSALGIFSVATSLMESVWVICKGIGVVHYSKSINLSRIEDQVKLAQKLVKISFIATLSAILIVFVVPNELLSWLVGKSFGNFKPIFFSLAPGVLFLATFGIIQYHFSSTDNNDINIKASILGNIITIITGFSTIHYAGIYAGGIATSLGYTAMMIYLFYVFNRKYQLLFSWVRIRRNELRTIFTLKEFD